MDKRIINADAFEKLLEWIVDNEEHVNDFVDIDGDYVHAYSLKEKINELSTPAPVAQEGIFDADGWCYNLSLMPLGKEIDVAFFSGNDDDVFSIEDYNAKYPYIGNEDKFYNNYGKTPYAWKERKFPPLPTRGDL